VNETPLIGASGRGSVQLPFTRPGGHVHLPFVPFRPKPRASATVNDDWSNCVKISTKRLAASAAAAALVLAACGGDDDESEATDAPATDAPATDAPATTEAPASGEQSGAIELAAGEVFVTGSSTVEPISIRVGELAAEQSGNQLLVTVEGPGTGDGFGKFCSGEADIAGASRPIRDTEIEECTAAGIEYTELEVAIDGLSVLTSPANDAVTCLDIPALYALVGPESEGFVNWSDANELAAELGSTTGDFPAVPLDIFGPGEESGTYDTFVEFAIADLAEERVGEDNVFTRADYSSSGNDNFIIEGIEGSETSLGWVGYAFFKAEQERLQAIEIDAGEGCVAPTDETIGNGSYPFSRSLYIYVDNAKAAENPAVASFVDLYLSDAGLAQVGSAGYVDLPAERIDATRAAWAGR
jgi:phosphate transport system substrate-binding protein